jgi:hypothetical protein
MTIIEFNEGLHDSVPVVQAGTAAFGLWTRSVCYLVRHGTDGRIPVEVIEEFDGPSLVDRLISAGLFQPVEDGWIHVPNGRVSSNGRPYWKVRVSRLKVPDALRAKIFERDGWRCLRCGSAQDLEIDHIFPVALGGDNAESNLQTLCKSCNSSKGARV